MAQAIRGERVTPADELRERLTASEKLVVNLRGKGAAALDLLRDLDWIAEVWPQMEEAGVDLRPEEGRWQTLQADVRKRASVLLAELRAVGGLPAARAKYHRDQQANWWWYLAEETRAANVRRLVRSVVTLVAVVALGALLLFLFNKLFPVDPQVRAAMVKMNSGQQKIERGADLTDAAADFQEAASLTPDDPDPWLWLGAVQQKLGDAAASQTSFEKARALAASELDFHAARIPVYAALQMYGEAEAAANAALAIDPNSPQVHYYLAGVYEAQGKLTEVIATLQRASELADARNQAELTAMARYRLAIMMQQAQVKAIGPTATPVR